VRVCVTTEIAAAPARVWRALTVPDEVSAWDGVVPVDVPAGYPRAGQHARWRSPVGPLRLTLHDRVRTVDSGRRLAAGIDVGFVHVDEEYRLTPGPGGGTTLVTDDEARSKVPGLDWLAGRLTRANVVASMARLKAFCESGTPR
jgi:uncharacterized protein YndB with AHSA1/START domain